MLFHRHAGTGVVKAAGSPPQEPEVRGAEPHSPCAACLTLPGWSGVGVARLPRVAETRD